MIASEMVPQHSAMILVVDDDPLICTLLQRVLEFDGYSVIVAADGAEALRAFEDRWPDAVLLDIMMPVMDGIEACTRIHALPGGNRIPVLMITARQDNASIERSFASGATDYITKPINTTVLRHRLRQLLRARRMEDALRASEVKYRALVEQIPAVPYVTALDERETASYISPQITALAGLAPAEWSSQPDAFLAQVHPDDRPYVQALINQRRAGHDRLHGEYRLIRRDGHTIWVSDDAVVVRNEAGQPSYIQGILSDITPRKAAEEALSKAHQENEHLLASILSLLIGVGADGAITYWNKAAETILGVTVSAAMGKPLLGCGVTWDEKQISQGIAACRQSGRAVPLGDIRYQHLDEHEGILAITVTPYHMTDDAQDGVLLWGEEVTERRDLEDQLSQAQRLESIGRLAAGIAHEINTPTQYVGDNVRFLSEAFAGMQGLLGKYEQLWQACQGGAAPTQLLSAIGETRQTVDMEYLMQEIPTALQQSSEGMDRISRIVRAMKEFSHPGVVEKTLVDINRALESTITVTRNEWKYVAEMEMELEEGLPPIPCLAAELNQAVLNILVNAAHAIEEAGYQAEGTKGKIRVSTRCVGEEVEIRIGDNGVGIPEKIRSKVFDPFFTTKKVGKGTGQGLAIARSVVVNKHGGTLTFESEVGKGTTFVIRLPIKAAPASQAGGEDTP
jgi:PAS domain S-box-containing protein